MSKAFHCIFAALIVAVGLGLVYFGAAKFLLNDDEYSSTDSRGYLFVEGRPMHSIALHRGVLYWFATQDILDFVEETYASPHGWEQTGLHFVFVEDSTKADICFEAFTYESSVCPSTATAYVYEKGVHLHFDGTSRISADETTEKQAIAWFLSLDQVIFRREVQRIVNHETGHVLGLGDLKNVKHRETRLMYNKTDATVIWPTSTEIDLVKHLIDTTH